MAGNVTYMVPQFIPVKTKDGSINYVNPLYIQNIHVTTDGEAKIKYPQYHESFNREHLDVKFSDIKDNITVRSSNLNLLA